jgi:hypothetical protein
MTPIETLMTISSTVTTLAHSLCSASTKFQKDMSSCSSDLRREEI